MLSTRVKVQVANSQGFASGDTMSQNSRLKTGFRMLNSRSSTSLGSAFLLGLLGLVPALDVSLHTG